MLRRGCRFWLIVREGVVVVDCVMFVVVMLVVLVVECLVLLGEEMDNLCVLKLFFLGTAVHLNRA